MASVWSLPQRKTVVNSPARVHIQRGCLVIQNQFLEVRDYPLAASLSFVLMAVITLGVLAYARVPGTEELA